MIETITDPDRALCRDEGDTLSFASCEKLVDVAEGKWRKPLPPPPLN